MTTETKVCWTSEDDKKAVTEGWSIFNINTPDPFAGHGAHIERIDDMETFASDSEAWVHVWKEANVNDSQFHLKAIAFLKQVNQEEYEFVENHLATLVES